MDIVPDMSPPMTVNSQPRRTFLDVVANYSERVLNENWFEERLKFIKERYPPGKTTYQTHYTYDEFKPVDYSQLRDSIVQGRGVKKSLLFNHHGEAYLDPECTRYQYDYCRVPWAPSTRPPYLFGLVEKRQQQWQKDRLYYQPQPSEAKESYTKPPPESLTRDRRANPKHLSPAFFPTNNSTKSWILRGSKILLAPEHICIPQLKPI